MQALRIRIAESSGSLTANSPSRLPWEMISLQELGHFFDMVARDEPVLAERRLQQIMQFAIGEKAILVGRFDRGQQRAQSFARGFGLRDDGLAGGLNRGEQATGDRLVDLGLGREKPVNVGGRHAQFAGDVGDRRLFEADLSEQPLSNFKDAEPSSFWFDAGDRFIFWLQPDSVTDNCYLSADNSCP